MGAETDQREAGDSGVQFDRAEFIASSATASASRQGGEASAAATCVACKRPIGDSYYSVGTQVVCDTCGQEINASRSKKVGIGRFLRAALFGFVGAVIGTGIWLAVRAA